MKAEEPGGELRYIYRRNDRLSEMAVTSLDAGITLASYSVEFQEAYPVGFYHEATNQVWLYYYLKARYALSDIREALNLSREHAFHAIEKFKLKQVI